jgi:hypothetical protein
MEAIVTADPTSEPLRFAYWVPNVSGGLVTSTIEQRTDWSFGYNRKLAWARSTPRARRRSTCSSAPCRPRSRST